MRNGRKHNRSLESVEEFRFGRVKRGKCRATRHVTKNDDDPRVTTLLRASGSAIYDAALAAYRRAEYDAALELLELDAPASDADRVRAALLRCWIARLRLEFDVWYERATFVAANATVPADRLTAESMLAVAAKRLGRLEEAARFSASVANAIEIPSGHAVDAAYVYALESWRDRDYDAAEAISRRFLSAGFGTVVFAQLLGWIEIKRERYAEGGKQFLRAFRAVSGEASPEPRQAAVLLHGIALVACDTVDMDLCRLAIAEYPRVEWHEQLWYAEFQLLICLQFCSTLVGDMQAAWEYARRAVFIAKEPTYRAIAECNAATISKQLGDVQTFEIQIANAWEIIRSVRWSATMAEERMALSTFALVAAGTKTAEARQALTILRSLSAKEEAYSALDRDRRSEAYDLWADARIHEVSGMRREAIDLYVRSFELWNEIGYILRTALVGLDLYRLTADERYLEPYEAVLALAPEAALPKAVAE